MWVRILTSVGGHPCGAEVEVDAATGANWIGTSVAERLPDPVPDDDVLDRLTSPDPGAMPEPEPVPDQAPDPVETAVADPPEVATAPQRRRRSGHDAQ